MKGDALVVVRFVRRLSLELLQRGPRLSPLKSEIASNARNSVPAARHVPGA
jgi:hypothetical protein